MSAPLRTKLLFWLILGALSTFFAEVVSGSYIYPFTTFWGLAAVIPLYLLHTLVLAGIVYNFGKPRIYTLFIAGMLFGMYEAYLTKILWFPGWGETPVTIAGIAVFETLVLVLFWHPLMAFIVPLFIAERVLTKSREIALPERIRKWSYPLLLLFTVGCGLTQSMNSPSPFDSLASGIGGSVVLLGLFYLWKRTQKEYTMKELLPDKKQLLVLFLLLLLMYIGFGLLLNPENLPGLVPQAVILGIYAVLIVLLWFSLKKSQKVKIVEVKPGLKFTWKLGIGLALLFSFTSALSKLVLGEFVLVFVLLSWVLGVLLGLVMFILSVRDVIS